VSSLRRRFHLHKTSVTHTSPSISALWSWSTSIKNLYEWPQIIALAEPYAVMAYLPGLGQESLSASLAPPKMLLIFTNTRRSPAAIKHAL
jgi:hypothetical protein